MGGDGPHGGKRNSSFALATLRPHGFAAVRGTGTLLTAPLNVSAPMLTVSADVEAGGSVRIGEIVFTLVVTPSAHISVHILPSHQVRIGIRPAPDAPVGLLPNKSVPLTANGTDVVMHFEGGCGGPDFTFLLGQPVQLEVQLDRASLFTVGWAPRDGGLTC